VRYRVVYPGSFDPPTWGHLDIIERASAIFDDVLIAVGVNSAKVPFFTAEMRLEALQSCTQHLSNVQTRCFEGLLVEFAKSVGARAIIRGLRAISDFDYEFQIAMANRRLSPDLETIFLMTNWEHSFLTSSVVREIALLGGDFSSFVPPEVGKLIAEEMSKRRVDNRG
jgi:pantetheine-phosphate adenylyltransferase